MDLNTEWMSFINNSENSMQEPCSNNTLTNNDIYVGSTTRNIDIEKPPKCSELYISTKTMIGYLSSPVDLNDIFWKIPIIPYSDRKEGIIKKQMKFNSTTKDEVEYIIEKCKEYAYVNPYIMQHIDNPTGRIKYKDVRKITIGISKKDVVSYRIKQKSAFYNCFVIIFRIEIQPDKYKEYHVKVFNTGKLELPGIRSDRDLELVYNKINTILGLEVSNIHAETVLINSNFTCGYYIKRSILYQILKHDYNISAMYDPCSYPGIQCKLYINPDDTIVTDKTTTDSTKYISFMIFRTGSVLIVGKCNEIILNNTYSYIVNILEKEYKQIIDQNVNITIKQPVVKKKKRRTILITKC